MSLSKLNAFISSFLAAHQGGRVERKLGKRIRDEEFEEKIFTAINIAP